MKASKLKSSKEQAEREISNYRNTCEQSYQRSVQQRSGDVGANANKLQAETGMKSNAIKAGIERLKPEVRIRARYVQHNFDLYHNNCICFQCYLCLFPLRITSVCLYREIHSSSLRIVTRLCR